MSTIIRPIQRACCGAQNAYRDHLTPNWPLVGGKMDLTEGGIRVPYVVHWPRGVAPGGLTDQLAITMYWVARFLEAADVRPHPDLPLDGVSLLPVLRDPRSRIDRELYWRMKHRDQRALRGGKWKYLATGANEYLFDVDTDERERANLAARHPDRLAAMRRRYAEWNATMPSVPDDARVSLIYTEKDMP